MVNALDPPGRKATLPLSVIFSAPSGVVIQACADGRACDRDDDAATAGATGAARTQTRTAASRPIGADMWRPLQAGTPSPSPPRPRGSTGVESAHADRFGCLVLVRRSAGRGGRRE